MPTYTVGTGKTYATIQAAVNAVPDNLIGTGIHTIEVYEGGSHEGNGYFYDEDVDAFTGFINNSASDYIVLKAMISHNGLRDTGIVIRGTNVPTGDYSIVLLYSFFVIDGFGITCGDNFDSSRVIGVSFEARPEMHTGFVYNCLVYDFNIAHGNAIGIFLGSWGSPEMEGVHGEIINCAVFNLESVEEGRTSHGIIISSLDEAWAIPTYVLNCSIQNILSGPQGYATGIITEEGVASSLIMNCVVGTCIGGLTACYANTNIAPTADYCVSSDDTADDFGGTHCFINQDPVNDIKFIVANQDLEDLHIQEGSCCKDTGTDLFQYGFRDDWEGDIRPCFLAWDIGADELCGFDEEGCCKSCCCCKNKNYFNGR